MVLSPAQLGSAVKFHVCCGVLLSLGPIHTQAQQSCCQAWGVLLRLPAARHKRLCNPFVCLSAGGVGGTCLVIFLLLSVTTRQRRGRECAVQQSLL